MVIIFDQMYQCMYYQPHDYDHHSRMNEIVKVSVKLSFYENSENLCSL